MLIPSIQEAKFREKMITKRVSLKTFEEEYASGLSMSREGADFLLTECERLFDEKLNQDDLPHLSERVLVVINDKGAETLYTSILNKFAETAKLIEETPLSIVKTTSTLKKMIETAKNVLKETEAERNLLREYENGDLCFLSDFEETIDKTKTLRQKWKINRELLPKEKAWLLATAQFSMELQEKVSLVGVNSFHGKTTEAEAEKESVYILKQSFIEWESAFEKVASYNPLLVKFSFQYKNDIKKIKEILNGTEEKSSWRH